MTDNNQQQLQLELKPEVAEGTYANLAIITHSSSEFITDFVQMMPGMAKAQVKSRIIMAPEHAKRLLFALQDNIQKYEQQFGQIRLAQPQQPSSEGRTIAPFTIKKGEA
ncbi:MAG: DUF3467 domain-containing protein [Prevotellaceae bacterium]|nr:DUF3467 domain-containing protein [Candidatus Minthosoma caballi]